MICAQNDDTSLLSEDSSAGFCECPSEQMVAGQGDLQGTSSLRSFILVEDKHYLEQVCVPLRAFNETCQYEQQCRGVDQNMACQETVTEEGVTSSVSVCACAAGFKWSLGYAPRARCVPSSARGDSGREVVADQNDGSTAGAEEDDLNEDSSDSPVDSNDMTYIWWIFPPALDESNSSLTSPSQRSTHGFMYYGSRLLTLTAMAYLLALIAILVPMIIVGIVLLVYCHRRIVQARQYQPRRASFTDSIYYPDNIPSTPSEKTKSVTFGFGPTDTTITPPSSPNAFKKGKKPEDKLDLVDNDQLEQVHRFP